MDIIDVMLAKAMTPQGKTDTYVIKANKAAQDAAQAKIDAQEAIATVTAAAQDISDAQSAAATLLETAQSALETAQAAQGDLPTAYSTTGQNTDGYMTQKAVTDALDEKVGTSILNSYATKEYVTNAVSNITITGGGGTINLGSENEGHLVTINNAGVPIASSISEGSLIDLMVANNKYVAENVVGLEINYERKMFTRVQEAANLSMGTSFNKYAMYGGRTRCNVADDGTINAFYGEDSYRDDGSNGMVMVYQPKFYYKRIINYAELQDYGQIVRHETLMLSAVPQSSFKLAPIFNGDLGYVLLPAYDASLIDNKLASIAGVEPVRYHTIEEMENYARARGTGWHIMNMAAESANQMLQIVEYGSMNGQNSLEKGIVTLPSGIGNTCAFITGSTAYLGNITGHATTTQMVYNGTTSNLTESGQRAISYRGMENPWGNLWSMVAGVSIVGDGNQKGGIPYICNSFNYGYGEINGDYASVGFTLPNTSGWVNAMGYGNEEYDWVYMPTECSNDEASSLWPIGDGIWINANLKGVSAVATGGSYQYNEECGPFYYATDRTANNTSRPNYGAKLLYIPTKNEIYDANIEKWTTYMGG